VELDPTAFRNATEAPTPARTQNHFREIAEHAVRPDIHRPGVFEIGWQWRRIFSFILIAFEKLFAAWGAIRSIRECGTGLEPGAWRRGIADSGHY
jgi:hypothetical protein